jgi:hypothetical protein
MKSDARETSTIPRLGAAAAIGALALGLASASHAATLFAVDTNPSQTTALNLDNASGITSGFGTVVLTDDVAVTTTGSSDFSSGNATIKPSGGSLTDIVFTPTNDLAFNAFSFRGQDLAANQIIDLIVTDQSGASESFAFSVAKANQDFTRMGIIAAMTGETIKSIELINSGGFKEAKLFAFGVVPAAGVPEPAAWASMLLGFGAIGAAMRRSRATRLA